MATFVGQVEDNEIIFVVWVSVPGHADEDPEYRSYNALLDTGAQKTMISPKVAKEVGLQAIGHMLIVPVTGQPIDTKKFRARIDIPIGQPPAQPVLRGRELNAGLLPYQPNNHDVLLGMDFISRFHLSMYGGNYILSN